MTIEELVRDKANEFPELVAPQSVTALRVWFCNYRTLSPLALLANLQTLVIAGYPDSDFDAIASLAKLQYLSILDFAKVTDLTPLGQLTELRTLRLHSPPSWDSSGRVIEVDSLAPIALLPRLEHLELFGVRPADQSLAALELAPNLRTVRVSKFPKPEVARYRAASNVGESFAPPPSAGWA